MTLFPIDLPALAEEVLEMWADQTVGDLDAYVHTFPPYGKQITIEEVANA